MCADQAHQQSGNKNKKRGPIMGEDDAKQGGPASLLDQARSQVNKSAKDGVITKLKANFTKRREHEIGIATHEEAMRLLDIENDKIVAEYDRGLI